MKLFICLFLAFKIITIVQSDDCQTPPPIKGSANCCDLPKLNNKEVYESCKNITNGWNEKDTSNNVLIECKLSECVMNKLNSVKDSKINSADFKESFKTYISDTPEWGPVFNTAVDKCESDSELKSEELKTKLNVKHNITECEPKFAFFNSCLMIQLMINCPAEHSRPSEDCTVLNSYLKKCPDQYSSRF